MHRRLLAIGLSLVALALPLSASQFVEMPFDDVAREAAFVVRGNVVETWSAWDASGEVIYTYATVRISRYFGEIAGPDTLVVREVGGTVEGYTQEAIGFPEVRRGEDVVMFLSQWEDGSEYRIHAFNQGKYLVRQREGIEVLVHDSLQQGDSRLPDPDGRFHVRSDAKIDEMPALRIEEFAAMVDAARAGVAVNRPDRIR